MFSAFTTSRRAGSGSPLVCLHGFMDTWRSWELVLPALERRHDVLALTLPGHAGGPPLADEDGLVDALERAIDKAAVGAAHLVGNSLGGWLAFALAARGRALSVVAFAPVGGWADGHCSYLELLDAQLMAWGQARALAPHADQAVATVAGRRRATAQITSHFEHIPAELLAHQLVGVANCDGAPALIERARRDGWPVEAELIGCPIRIVWGTDDKLVPSPAAAARYRAQLSHADWVVLDGVGHCPQLNVPAEAAELIVGFTA
jgi:pimeloyl-ACP methyl ester carboxylesterase